MKVSRDKMMERLARELGALTINNHLLTIEVDQYQEQLELDIPKLDALSRRVMDQDNTIKELNILVETRKLKKAV